MSFDGASLARADAAHLVRRFERPEAKYGPLPIWWWSGDEITSERVRWQMRQLLSQGISQAVVMNLAPTGPLYGSLADEPRFMSEPWWDLFIGACIDAEEMGFTLWLYDQIGFSGANIQGHIVAENAEMAGEAIGQLRVAVQNDESRAVRGPEGSRLLGAWFVSDDHKRSRTVELGDGQSIFVAEAKGELVIAFAQSRGFDYFSEAASAMLIDTVFGEYHRRCAQWFGRSIGGFFQDELPQMPSWSANFAAAFADVNGYSILDHLPELWGDSAVADSPVSAEQIRLDYHGIRVMLAKRGFFDPLADWYESVGLNCGFDQQTPAREGDPVGTVAIYGDYLDTHSRFGIPGSDHWGDSKLHSSLAHASGHERVWIESFHSSGWGGTLEETYDWLTPFFRRGASLYNPHAVYYSTHGGWWEWAPPSTCWRQPYWPAYHAFADTVKRLCSLLTVGEHVASTVLYFPTETVQASLTADGQDLRGPGRDKWYHELNGSTSWFSESPGLLEAAGIDYDILSHSLLRKARVERGRLIVGDEAFVNVVLPGVTVLSSHVAGLLAELSAQGGRVICVGDAPTMMTREADEETGGTSAFAARVERGDIVQVHDPSDVVKLLKPPDVSIVTTVPYLHRRYGETHVVMLIAHDAVSGTKQPMLDGFERHYANWGGNFDWSRYWSALREDGYEFVPPGERTVSVGITGLSNVEVQRWDPQSGLRSALPATQRGHELEIETDFCDGSVVILVIGPDLPDPTSGRLVELMRNSAIDGPWRLTAESTLDNQWGDLGDPLADTAIPIQVWEFAHSVNGSDEPSRALATFGPFAEVTGPHADYRPTSKDGITWDPYEWSLSRGIDKDPIHDESLGPNGYVPEEFLLWSDVKRGQWCAIRTYIAVPENESAATFLAIGANASRTVYIDGEEQESIGDGYLTFTTFLPSSASVEIWLQAVDDGDIRSSFALIVDRESYRRPEWIELADGSEASTTVEVSTTFSVPDSITDTRIQVSSEAPTIIIVNGIEIARQGDFDPYSEKRFTRVHPYDVRAALKPGTNELVLRAVDVGRPVAIRLDSVPSEQGGLGVTTDREWIAQREGAPSAIRSRYAQFEDPRYGCLVPRPHPLQLATWLESAARNDNVLTVIPDIRPDDARIERLAFLVPLGATCITVPSDILFSVEATVGVTVTGNQIHLQKPAHEGAEMAVVFHPYDGRRGGALLNGPLIVDTTEQTASLRPWHELGYDALAGLVRYRADLPAVQLAENERLYVNLGIVRGTAEISVDGTEAATLFGGPWRADVSTLAGDNASHSITVTVRGTLAPYLQFASPTRAIVRGQTVHGMFGPVELEIWCVA